MFASLAQPMVNPAVLRHLPIVVPAVVCSELRRRGVACGIKWPNDLLLDGGKLGGILIESISSAAEPRVAIVGVGLNARVPEGVEGVASLPRGESGLGAFSADLLSAIVEALDGFRATDAASWTRRYEEMSVHRLGDTLTCRTSSETLEGAFRGFDERGFLRLDLGTGERVLSTADLVETPDV